MLFSVSCSAQTALHDPFTGRLMEIYRKILFDERIKEQPKIILELHRSDYMLHEVDSDPRTFMQVELNTIASSFGALSSKVTEQTKE
jgi:glutathione synthase